MHRTLTAVACASLAMPALLRAEPAASPAASPAAGEDATSALVAAARKGDGKAIARLLEGGAKVDARGEYGVTPLFAASLYGQADAAKLLIEKGADLRAATSDDGTTPLHAAAFFCHTGVVKRLLGAGARINALNGRSETPLDAVAGSWSRELGELYTGLGRAIGLEIDLERIEAERPRIAALLRSRGGQRAGELEPESGGGGTARIAALGLRSSYYKDGEIHVNVLGTPEGKPVTSGHWDFKPSWSKTGDRLVFFRRLKNDPVVTNWVTAICIIGVDGTGFRQLTDGTHTDFNQTWTRDGSETPIWNRRNRETGGFYVMRSRVDARPGEEVAITDRRHHTWAYTCLEDGRILVQSNPPGQGWGYFLMTPPGPGETARYERIDCELARAGILDRVSLSPSEKKVCFEYQRGFRYKDTGRTLYLADFDAGKRTITNARPFANVEGRPDPWFAYPRWNRDETVIVYHANETGKGALWVYTLEDGSTTRVSTDPRADYRYPHFEDVPK